MPHLGTRERADVPAGELGHFFVGARDLLGESLGLVRKADRVVLRHDHQHGASDRRELDLLARELELALRQLVALVEILDQRLVEGARHRDVVGVPLLEREELVDVLLRLGALAEVSAGRDPLEEAPVLLDLRERLPRREALLKHVPGHVTERLEESLHGKVLLLRHGPERSRVREGDRRVNREESGVALLAVRGGDGRAADGDRPAEAVAREDELRRAGGGEDLGLDPGQLLGRVLGEPDVAVSEARPTPVEDEQVETGLLERADERGRGREVDDVGAIDHGHDEEERRRADERRPRRAVTKDAERAFAEDQLGGGGSDSRRRRRRLVGGGARHGRPAARRQGASGHGGFSLLGKAPRALSPIPFFVGAAAARAPANRRRFVRSRSGSLVANRCELSSA